VIVVKKLAIFQLLKMLLKPKRFNSEKVEVFHTTRVSIKAKHDVHFQIDGEYLGKIKQLNASIESAQLNLILPKE
jgi:diacylglycerol kinase family enzyme